MTAAAPAPVSTEASAPEVIASPVGEDEPQVSVPTSSDDGSHRTRNRGGDDGGGEDD